MSKMTKADYYQAMMDRLSHVESLRHGIMAVELSIVGVVLGQFFSEKGAGFLAKEEGFVPALVLTVASIKLLELMAHNLFAKSMRAATEMMIIEYSAALVKEGIGYFSFRRGRKRLEFWISGLAPEVLLLFYVIALTILAKDEGEMKQIGYLVEITCFASFCIRCTVLFKIFKRKDAIEEECEKVDSQSLGERLFAMRALGKKEPGRLS